MICISSGVGAACLHRMSDLMHTGVVCRCLCHIRLLDKVMESEWFLCRVGRSLGACGPSLFLSLPVWNTLEPCRRKHWFRSILGYSVVWRDCVFSSWTLPFLLLPRKCGCVVTVQEGIISLARTLGKKMFIFIFSPLISNPALL